MMAYCSLHNSVVIVSRGAPSYRSDVEALLRRNVSIRTCEPLGTQNAVHRAAGGGETPPRRFLFMQSTPACPQDMIIHHRDGVHILPARNCNKQPEGLLFFFLLEGACRQIPAKNPYSLFFPSEVSIPFPSELWRQIWGVITESLLVAGVRVYDEYGYYCLLYEAVVSAYQVQR